MVSDIRSQKIGEQCVSKETCSDVKFSIDFYLTPRPFVPMVTSCAPIVMGGIGWRVWDSMDLESTSFGSGSSSKDGIEPARA